VGIWRVFNVGYFCAVGIDKKTENYRADLEK
jgi:hypothetical protein